MIGPSGDFKRLDQWMIGSCGAERQPKALNRKGRKACAKVAKEVHILGNARPLGEVFLVEEVFLALFANP